MTIQRDTRVQQTQPGRQPNDPQRQPGEDGQRTPAGHDEEE